MYKGRLFTFGCSFTQFKWPTWADLLGLEFEKHYNFGKSGAGNLYIGLSISEAHARYKFTSADTILVMWTNVTREDRYTDGWLVTGNLYTQKIYDKDFLDKFVTIRGCYVRDLAIINLAYNILESVGCAYEFMSMVDIDNYSQYSVEDSKDKVHDLLALYKDSISKFKPSIHNVIYNYDWQSKEMVKGKMRDNLHPTPLEHLQYITEILPYTISQSTKDLANILTNEIITSYQETNQYEDRSWNKFFVTPKDFIRL